MHWLGGLTRLPVRAQVINQSINQSINQLIHRCLKQATKHQSRHFRMSQSLSNSTNQPASQSSLVTNAAAIRVGVAITVIRNNQSTSQSINRSTSESINQSINQSVNQSINQSQPEFLLIKRGKAPMMNYWALPGGSIEAGETATAAAKRELSEECGIDCDMIEPFYSTDVILSTNQSVHKAYHFVLIHVLAARLSKEQEQLIKAGDDAIDAQWFTREQIEEMNQATELAEQVKKSINQSNGPVNDNSVVSAQSIVPRVGEVVDRAVVLYNRIYGMSK